MLVTALPPARAIHYEQPAVTRATGRATADTVRDERALLARIDSLRIAQRIPGLAVVVLRDTTVVLSHAFGDANIAKRTPVTVETPFNIASVSKSISAVVALRLVQDKLLDLDRPMRSYTGFDEFCASARASGGVFFRDYACAGNALTLRHVLSMSANGTPGTRFWYNPPSYSWASRPMMQVTGTAFSALVDSLVLKPAGMQHSARIHRALPLRASLVPLLATPYHTDSSGAFVESDPPAPQGDGAAGGVIATAMDLARFDIALMTNRLIAPATRAALWRGTKTPAGTTLPYGLGFFLGTLDGHRVAWHTGLWEGQYSALYLKTLSDVPRERVTIILLANSDGLQWPSRLDEAAIERSPFATLLLREFRGR